MLGLGTRGRLARARAIFRAHDRVLRSKFLQPHALQTRVVNHARRGSDIWRRAAHRSHSWVYAHATESCRVCSPDGRSRRARAQSNHPRDGTPLGQRTRKDTDWTCQRGLDGSQRALHRAREHRGRASLRVTRRVKFKVSNVWRTPRPRLAAVRPLAGTPGTVPRASA